ncbi:helix-turn-helix domain-containing protein [Tsuneonella sp. HG249]
MVVKPWPAGCKTSHPRLLCEMAVRFSVMKKSPIEYELLMTQEHLADATGLTSVHISRSLKSLREVGTVFRNFDVQIEDWDALVAVAEFDRSYLQVDLTDRVRLAAAAD